MNVSKSTVKERTFNPVKEAVEKHASSQAKGYEPPVKYPLPPVQPATNKTAMPGYLKTGIENITGLSMQDVQVHYNSPEPTQLNALAYASGNQIHLAPGQEEHLPHEAWHVVQQKQGRVRRTSHIKAGVAVNDDHRLESEANIIAPKIDGTHQSASLPETLYKRGLSPVISHLPGAEIVSSHTYTGEVVQRVTPKLSETIGWGYFENKGKLAPVFRNTLILLKGQLRRIPGGEEEVNVATKKDLIKEVNDFFSELEKEVELSTEKVDDLIDRVNKFDQLMTAGKNQVQPSSLRQLNVEEKEKFDTMIDVAVDLAKKTKDMDEVLQKAFSIADTSEERKITGNNAKENFALIIEHLEYWKNNKPEKVVINTANSGYNAYNQGLNNNSVLTINNTAFEDHKKSAYTLIHEASHASVATRDLGYMGAPYFLTMPDKFRLNNADHYSYAAQLADKNSELDKTEQINNAGEANFLKAKGLAYFKAERIWTYLMWMKDTYGGKDYVPKDTLNKHAKWIGLESRNKKAINIANTELLVVYYNSIKDYLKKDMDVDLANSAITMGPKDGSRKITVGNVDSNKSVDEISGSIFDAMFDSFGFPSNWNVHQVGMKLFNRLFVKGKDLREGDKPKPVEKELYEWFRKT